MKQQLQDLESILNIVKSVQNQLKITLSHEKEGGRKYKEELKTLLTEYKLLQTKKVKVDSAYEGNKLEFLGVVNGNPVISANNLKGADYRGQPNLRNYERLVDDYGHRRYIRKAQRNHRIGFGIY